MHKSSLKRMEWFVASYLEPRLLTSNCQSRPRVLDVGSYDVNGSYKKFFPCSDYDYIGLDMVAGPNVDYVPHCSYRWHELSSDSFDAVISGQALEHIEFFWITVIEMVRVLKQGGILCLIAPNGFGEHRHPVDCYRFFADGMIALARYTSLDIIHAHTDFQPSIDSIDWHEAGCEDSMLIAQKPYAGDTVLLNLDSYVCNPADLSDVTKPLHPYTLATSSRHNHFAIGLTHRVYRKIGRLIGAI